MLEGLYSAAAGMVAQQGRMDAVSNDIANVNTNGYKHQRVGFRDLLYGPAGQGAARSVQSGAGAASWTMGRGQGQGALRATGRSLDVALQGPGYLQVRRPDGALALTRNGALQVDGRGRLATSDGSLLAPAITLPRGVTESEVTLDPQGRLTARGQVVGRLVVVDVPAPDGLQAAGDSLFLPTAASGAPRAAGPTTTVQGSALEASNVDLSDALVGLIEAQRSFGLASQAVRTQDQVLEIANGVKR